MTIDIQEAIRCYHEAATPKKQDHVVLILDKALHMFPWESLPCLRGRSVSRLPSIGSLMERVVVSPIEGASWPSVSANKGFFVLNPSGDLTHTQSQFETNLSKYIIISNYLLTSELMDGTGLWVARQWTRKSYRLLGITTSSCTLDTVPVSNTSNPRRSSVFKTVH